MANIYINRESVLRIRAKENQEFYATKMEVENNIKEKINAIQEKADGLSRVLEHAATLIQTRQEDQAQKLLADFLAEGEAPPAKPTRKRTKKDSAE